MNNQTGKADGERLKAEKLALLEARREVYVRRGRRALLAAMLDGDGRATADDVRRAVALPPEIDPRCLGSVPRLLALAGIIRRADFAKSGRAERHASYIGVWQLIDRPAAERWLAANPDLPDPADDDRGRRSQRAFFLLTTNTPTPTVAAAGAGLEQ